MPQGAAGQAQAADGRPLPYRPERVHTLGAWAEGLLWAVTAAWAIVLGLGIQQRSAWQDFAHEGTPDRAGLLDVVDAEDAYGGGLLVVILLGLVLAVVFLMWLHRTYKQAAAPDAALRFTPAVAVGVWFLPIVNLFVAPRVLNDTWRLTGPDAAPPRGDRWRSEKSNPWVWGWLVAAVLGGVTLGVAPTDATTATLSELDRHYDFLAVAPVFLLAATLAQAMFVRTTRRRLFRRDTGAVA